MTRLSITHFLNFLFYISTMKQAVENVSGYCAITTDVTTKTNSYYRID